MLSKISAVVIGLLLVLGLGSSASADLARYPISSGVTGTIAPGGTVTFTASGFEPGSTVTVTTNGPSGTRTDTVTATGAGTVSLPVVLGSAGRYTFVASGTGADGNPLTVSETLQVSAGATATPTTTTAAAPAVRGNAGSTGGSLARTGVDGLATTAWVGFGVLVLGGVLVAVASGRGRTRQEA